MLKTVIVLGALFMLVSCASSPQEIRETEPMGNVSLAMGYEEGAACVANMLDSSVGPGGFSTLTYSHDVRYYENPNFAEVIGREPRVTMYVIRLVPESEDVTNMETRIWTSFVTRKSLYKDIIEATESCQQGVAPQLYPDQ